MLDRKQFERFEFKMGQKAAPSTTRLAHELLRSIQGSDGSWSSAKETRALTWGAQRSAVGSWQQQIESHHQSWSTYNSQEVAEELNIDHSMFVWLLKQIRMVKKLNKWVPLDLTEDQKKNHPLKCCLLLLYAIMNHFSIRFWCAMKSGVHVTTSDYQLSV